MTGKNKYQEDPTYLVVYFRKGIDEYPVIERRTRDEIIELRRKHLFKDMAILKGELWKGFGVNEWSGIK